MNQYAGFVTRAIAFVTDAAIINTVAIVFAAAVALAFSILPGSQHLQSLGLVLASAAFVLWCIAYLATFWATTGQTPGARVMHLRVERLDGETLHVGMAIVRVVATALAALPFFAGFIPVFFTSKRRGVPDWIASTVVVRTDPAGPPLAAAERARPARAERIAADLRSDPLRGSRDNGTHHADDGPVVGAGGLDGDQNGRRAAEVDVDLGVGATTAHQDPPVELGDVTGERGT